MLVAMLFFVTVPAYNDADERQGSGPLATHTPLAEFGTATWCGYCKYAHAALKNVYAGTQHDFYYISFVTDKNSYALQRTHTDYNVYGYPTVWFDGGDEVVVGAGSTSSAESNYNAALTSCENRAVYDVDVQLNVQWLGSATMNVAVSVDNNEASQYNGRVRVYVTEKVSSMGWYDTNGYPYTFAFLNYAFNQPVSIAAGGSWSDSTTWNGNDYGFGTITHDNIMVIAAVFNDDWHQGYSYPPSGYPFDAYYCDDSLGMEPTLDSEPPVIWSTAACPPIKVEGHEVNISAIITDNTGVGAVAAIVDMPGAGKETMNATMNHIAGTDSYYYAFDALYPGDYTYYIWCEDVNGNGNVTVPETFPVLLMQNYSLFEGWNLITLPGEHTYTAKGLLNAIDGCSIVYSYNASTGTPAIVTANSPPEDDFDIENGTAVFIALTDPKNFSFSAEVFDNLSVHLYPGWNMIGWCNSRSTTAKSILENITDCAIVYWYDASTGMPKIVTPSSPPENDFAVERGMGLFVAVTTESDWHGEG
jgi:thiol-disulfide isomerase/thioredoxin